MRCTELRHRAPVGKRGVSVGAVGELGTLGHIVTHDIHPGAPFTPPTEPRLPSVKSINISVMTFFGFSYVSIWAMVLPTHSGL